MRILIAIISLIVSFKAYGGTCAQFLGQAIWFDTNVAQPWQQSRANIMDEGTFDHFNWVLVYKRAAEKPQRLKLFLELGFTIETNSHNDHYLLFPKNPFEFLAKAKKLAQGLAYPITPIFLLKEISYRINYSHLESFQDIPSGTEHVEVINTMIEDALFYPLVDSGRFQMTIDGYGKDHDYQHLLDLLDPNAGPYRKAVFEGVKRKLDHPAELHLDAKLEYLLEGMAFPDLSKKTEIKKLLRELQLNTERKLTAEELHDIVPRFYQALRPMLDLRGGGVQDSYNLAHNSPAEILNDVLEVKAASSPELLPILKTWKNFCINRMRNNYDSLIGQLHIAFDLVVLLDPEKTSTRYSMNSFYSPSGNRRKEVIKARKDFLEVSKMTEAQFEDLVAELAQAYLWRVVRAIQVSLDLGMTTNNVAEALWDPMHPLHDQLIYFFKELDHRAMIYRALK